jgi:hypothetical protein
MNLRRARFFTGTIFAEKFRGSEVCSSAFAANICFSVARNERR